jgi:hypothetical protein
MAAVRLRGCDLPITRVRESQIRASLLLALRDRHGADPNTLIRQELGLCAGARRVDLAMINGELVGFEIKSDQDTLYRLAGQAEAYGQVLDRVTLVTTARYIDKAAALVPTWWGLIRADPADGSGQTPTGNKDVSAREAVLTRVRPAALNTEQDPFAVVQLLWREEALAILRERGLHRGLERKRRWIIWQHLAEAIPLPELRALTRDQLRARRTWPGGH